MMARGYLILLFVLSVGCVTGRTLRQEIISVTQHTPTPRVKRDLGPGGGKSEILSVSDYPDFMEFTLHLSDSDVKLSLEKHNSLDDARIGDEFGDLTKDPSNERMQFVIYQDIASKSSMVVECGQNSDTCTLSGSFYKDGKKWTIKPTTTYPGAYEAAEAVSSDTDEMANSVKLGDTSDDAEVSRIYKQILDKLKHDGDVQTKSSRTKRGTTNDVLSRKKRQTPPCNIVEVMALADHTIWEFYLAKQNNDVIAAEMELEKDFYALYGQVDLRFKCLSENGICMRVSLIGIQIEKNSPGFAETSSIPGYKDAYQALLACSDLSTVYRVPADFLICMTSYIAMPGSLVMKEDPIYSSAHQSSIKHLGRTIDLPYPLENEGFLRIRSYTFVDYLCENFYYQAGVVRYDHDDADLSIARDILNMMGVAVDGDGNPCDSNDTFVNAAENIPPNSPSTIENPWKFSPCSITGIQTFIQNKDCLRIGASTEASLNANYQTTPGTDYDSDLQCKLGVNLTSQACIGPNETSITDVEDMCWRGLYCTVNGTCQKRVRIFNGSPCGCKKSCYKNVCVRDFNTPLGGNCTGMCECVDPYTECDPSTKKCRCIQGYYNDDGICEEFCDILPLTTNGYFRVNQTIPQHGAVAVLDCCEGYHTSTTIYITCSPAGWSLPSEMCRKKDCGIPDVHVANGTYIPSDSTVGSIATLNCDEGYTPTYTPMDTCIVCQPDGNWSTADSTCIRDCGPLPMTPDGNYKLNGSVTRYGAVATLHCCSGYETMPTITITCQDGGWSSHSETCQLKDCGPPDGFINNGNYSIANSGTTVGSIAWVSCYDGYSVTSTDTCIVCQPNGNWSTTTADCIKDCGLVPKAKYGYYHLANPGTTDGAVAELKCCEGYETDNPVTITCTSQGWSSPNETCTLIDCCDPDPINNGFYVVLGDTTVNSVATLFCCDNFEPSFVDTAIVCQFDGTWSETNTTCISEEK